MNILPLVSAFIILFALGSYTIIPQFRASIEQKKHYSGTHLIQREFANKLERLDYKTYEGKNCHPKDRSENNNSEQYHSFRSKHNPAEESKLDISPLLQEKKDPAFEKIVLTFIKNLYEYTLDYSPGLEKKLLDLIVETGVKDPKINSLEKLYAKLPRERDFFYKFLKGTQSYTLNVTDSGYPPLGNYITLSRDLEKKPVNGTYASLPLLESLFGTFAFQIVEAEKAKWKKEKKHLPLTEQEYKDLLVKNRKNPSDYEKWIRFNAKKGSENTFLIKDESSPLQITFSK